MNGSTFDQLKEWALLLLALYGAALSTFNWYYERSKTKRVVRVTHGYKYPITYTGDIGPEYLEIRATNAGERQVTIATLTLEHPNGGWFANQVDAIHGLEDTARPFALSDGETGSAHFSMLGLRSALRRNGFTMHTTVRPLAVDTLGTRYRGAPIGIDPSAVD